MRIGAGLHVGWAIEGAIGTNQKIDASYISPHVNMTEFLESSTKQYGVPLILSEPFTDMLSPSVRKYCRQINKVKLGEDEPIGMFVYDADVESLHLSPNSSSVHQTDLNSVRKSSRRPSIAIEISGRAEKNQFTSINENIKHHPTQPIVKLQPYKRQVWEEDIELRQLNRHISKAFRKIWDEGIKAYFSGNWIEARMHFTKTLTMNSKVDGPSRALLDIMRKYEIDNREWKGYDIID